MVDSVDMTGAVSIIDGWIRQRAREYVTVTPAHAVMEAYRDTELRHIFNRAGLTTPDGMAIVWLLRLRGHKKVRRVYGPDLLLEVSRTGVPLGYRHLLYGGTEGVAARLSACLTARFPGIRIVGTHTPPFRALAAEEDQAIVDALNASRADIVWVGLSTPKQERWMAEHRHQLEAPVLVGVGAAFDFLSGAKPQAPRWMQRSGLEWLFRLASEPRRLWPRYRQYPRFGALALAQLLGLRDFPEA
jgi:N-acetylglucosaminyldiphosphoundecaprenol N-acetyl-beta-D-mannosaminyltransferase